MPQQANEGPYQVTSTIDLSVEAILPQQAELVVQTLRDFSQNPAHTLITLAGQYGVPEVAALYDALPSILTDQLESWINGEIAKIQIAGKPVTEWAGDIAGLADTALTKFALDSTLAIDAKTATHTLTAIDFSPTGILHAKLPLTGLPADILTQTPDVAVAAGGALTLGDQQFGLAYGEYAWQGLNAAVTLLFGADIRTELGNAVDCPKLAQDIANKCVLTVCVGHASELQAICEGGLDALVDTVHAQFSALRFDVFEFASGTGTLVDDNGDGVADRITDSVWDAQMNLGMGPRHAPATWTAERASTNAAP